MPPKPTLKNVRTGPPPSPQMETLPMPVFDDPAADPPAQPAPEPALDDAQVVALAAELGKADAVTEQPVPAYPTSDGCQDPPPPALQREPEIARLFGEVANLGPEVRSLRAEVASLTAGHTALVSNLRILKGECDGVRERVESLVSSLDPAVRERLAPLLVEVQALRSAPAQGLQAVVETVEGLRRAVSAVEARNPDAADVHGAVQQVRDEVSAFVRDFPARARSLWDEWRREVAVYSPPLDSPYAHGHSGDRRWGQGTVALEYPQEVPGQGVAPVVEFTVLHRGVQFKPHQNPDGSVGLRLNIVPGAKHPMGEMSIPRTGEAVREVDFGYGVTIPPGWLADVTCAPLQPGQPSPQQRSYITTLGGSTPPGQTLVLQLHCASGARGVASGTEVCRLHLRRVEPAGLRVTDGVQTPLQAAVRTEEAARVLADKDAEIARLRALLESGHRLPQPAQHVADGRGLVYPGVGEAPVTEVPTPQRHWPPVPTMAGAAPGPHPSPWSERGGKL